MMHNQVEQIIYLQNKFYEKLLDEKRQVCGVNTRGGSSTQDPHYLEGHPKKKEQEARKKKSFAGESPNKKLKKMRTLKIKIMIYLFLILKLKMIIMNKMWKYLNHMKNHLKMLLIKNLSL
jgi:hypothetical protein